jgi:hypothetical protein
LNRRAVEACFVVQLLVDIVVVKVWPWLREFARERSGLFGLRRKRSYALADQWRYELAPHLTFELRCAVALSLYYFYSFIYLLIF